ncbi:tumor necrosis factor a (TNF superfamily, member 2) [Chanos chanos]|uniref:Lymphotoxin-alpha n=1 Tax=Chanos chanos TaxID=29144 RepID=A0A6J2WJ82_CHACN|nr:tumor necrosis factor-like [Chanos chanos]
MSSTTQTTLDVESGVLPTEQVLVVRQKKSSMCSNSWKLCAALLAVALCVAAAGFTMQHQKKNIQQEGEGLHLSLRQVSASSKDAIHLAGDYNPDFSHSSVQWRDNEGQSFSKGHLKLHDNEIIIPHDGLYFVYTQVSFSVNCKVDTANSDDLDIVRLSHTVSRWSDSYGSYKPLLNGLKSVCKRVEGEDDGERWHSAVYLGAVFKLHAKDRLRTETVEEFLPNLETDDGKNFFGVFSL